MVDGDAAKGEDAGGGGAVGGVAVAEGAVAAEAPRVDVPLMRHRRPVEAARSHLRVHHALGHTSGAMDGHGDSRAAVVATHGTNQGVCAASRLPQMENRRWGPQANEWHRCWNRG